MGGRRHAVVAWKDDCDKCAKVAVSCHTHVSHGYDTAAKERVKGPNERWKEWRRSHLTNNGRRATFHKWQKWRNGALGAPLQ